jgi:hypothetical protein
MLRNSFVLLTCLAAAVQADVPPAQLAEVEHLINFVQNSQCVIARNGTEHPAEEAVAHIQKKYDYFRDDIKNTEDFIEYSASRSTMSGKDYTVTCPGRGTLTTRQWLLDELSKFRAGE